MDYFGNIFYLRVGAMRAFKKAEQIGRSMNPPVLLKMNSSHRGIARQEKLYAEALRKYGSPSAARKWCATPGGSPHHTGGAIDVAAIVNGKGGIRHANQKYLKIILPQAGWVNYEAEAWHWEIYTKRWKRKTGATGIIYENRLAAIKKSEIAPYVA
jgi:D-alanyl-D-alanine dipeptidase